MFVVEDEAEESGVRSAALAGETMASIARDLDEPNVPTTAGKPWRHGRAARTNETHALWVAWLARERTSAGEGRPSSTPRRSTG